MNGVGLADWVDDLFRRAIEEPGTIDDIALGDWLAEAGEIAGTPPDKLTMRLLRRAVRDARKLVRHAAAAGAPPVDWRGGVDEALGSQGWVTQLDLVEAELTTAPSAAAFEAMRERYRAVHFQPWQEGVSYEEWLEEEQGTRSE